MSRAKGPSKDPKTQARQVCSALARAYPEATCALTHTNPYQLLVATILSAQCTDVRVNMVTPELFRRFPDAASLGAGGARRARGPDPFDRLLSRQDAKPARDGRPGGRAPRRADPTRSRRSDRARRCRPQDGECRAGDGLRNREGIVVDTHVKRLARRLGLTSRQTPEQIERDLMEVIPRRQWVDLSHRLIQHGRRVCLARRPRCDRCTLASICPKIGVKAAAEQPPRRRPAAGDRRPVGPLRRSSR